MAQGILANLNGGEQTTLIAALQAAKDALDATIALGYPVYNKYDASKEKEMIFHARLSEMSNTCAKLIASVTDLSLLTREKI